MSIRVGDLVEQPHLRLELVAGHGGLDRIVAWAHASDLANPWDWLAGGEILMKNGRTLPRSAARQAEFIERLAAASVSALVIGTDPMTPPFSARAVAQAEVLSLAVLRVPYSMSFMAISRAVADAVLESEARRMMRIERIYSTIRAGDSDAPLDVLGLIEAELGCRLHVLDPSNLRVVLAGGRQPDRWLLNDLRAALAEHDARLPGVLHLPRRARRTGLAVDVPYEEPTMLVAEQPRGSGFDLALLHHAAMATAIAVGIQSIRDDFQAEFGAATLAQMINTVGAVSPLEGLVRRHGLHLDSSRLLVAARPSAEVIHRIAIALRRREIRHLFLAQDDNLWLLVEDVDAATDVLTSRLPPATPLGISAPVGTVGRSREAAKEALFALSVAIRRPVPIARFGELDALSAVHDITQARAFVEGVLGPVLRYDCSHGSDLVGSLTTFLSCRRSWSRTAAALHVHRQTVVYRMKKVADLTGRSLSETADLAELWHAISALDLLGPDSTTAR